MEIVKVRIDDISEYQGNSRSNEKAVGELVKDIDEYGFNNPIILNHDKVIIAGHARLKACKKMGMEDVDCVFVEMDKGKQDEYRIIDNKIQELSSWDEDRLAIEIRGGMNSEAYMKDFGEGVERAVVKLKGDKRTPTKEMVGAAQKKEDDRFDKAIRDREKGIERCVCKSCGEEFEYK